MTGGEYIRVLPSFVVNLVLPSALFVVFFVLVVAFDGLDFDHLGFVKQFMMKAVDFFVFSIGRLRLRCWRHDWFTTGKLLILVVWWVGE